MSRRPCAERASFALIASAGNTYRPRLTKTFAELSLEEKNLISHRAIAVKKLINFLVEKYK
jgi:hypothetical protein